MTGTISEALATGDTVSALFTNPLAVIQWFQSHKGELSQLDAIFKQLEGVSEPQNSEEGLKARIKIVLQALPVVAAITPSTVDDTIVDYAEKILNNDALIGLVAKLVAPHLSGPKPEQPAPANPNQPQPVVPVAPPVIAPLAALPAEVVNAHRADVEALGFDWSKVVKLLPIVISIVKLFV